MIRLRDKDSGVVVGTITEEQLKFLEDRLEEESAGDNDYYINAATLDMFEEEGADKPLLDLLRGALGDRDDMEIEWLRD